MMLGSSEQRNLIDRYGGPINWSQSLNVAAIGAGLASVELHQTDALISRQEQLKRNLVLFDSLLPCQQSGSHSPIRLVRVGNADAANRTSALLADQGFFTSAVFFPVVPRNQAAVRITLRSDMTPTLIKQFCALLSTLLDRHSHGLQ